LFLEAIYSIQDDFLLKYGARYTYTDYNNFDDYIEPRTSILYKVDAANNLSFATGIYTQMPQGYKTIQEIGSDQLNYERAQHYVLHYDNSYYEGTKFSIDGFYKKYYDLAIDDKFTNYASKGEGYAKGVDANIKIRQGDYYLYGAYTYINSKRELSTQNDYLYRFYGEIPHTLQFIVGKKLWNNWALSTRMQYHSGKPYTKVIGTYLDAGRVRPVYEDPFNSRLPDYFSLNVKIAQQLKLSKNESLEWSFEIMNLTNHENVSEINYDDNYNKTGYAKQLPLLPWFDVTYRF
jgi:hypothetical protein